jgi:hypothetical protein
MKVSIFVMDKCSNPVKQIGSTILRSVLPRRFVMPRKGSVFAKKGNVVAQRR